MTRVIVKCPKIIWWHLLGEMRISSLVPVIFVPMRRFRIWIFDILRARDMFGPRQYFLLSIGTETVTRGSVSVPPFKIRNPDMTTSLQIAGCNVVLVCSWEWCEKYMWTRDNQVFTFKKIFSSSSQLSNSVPVIIKLYPPSRFPRIYIVTYVYLNCRVPNGG